MKSNGRQIAQVDRCLFLLADGARPDVFAQLFKAGELPEIQRHIKERGSFKTAVTTFPSTTGPAFLPFLTGCFPGTLDVPGIRWLDRQRTPVGPLFWQTARSYVGPESYLINRDLPRDIPTLFELAGRSANIMSLVNRGSGIFGNKTKILRAICWLYGHYTGNWRPVDRLAARITRRAIKEGRRFIFSLFPAIDEMAHLSEPFSPTTLAAYRGLDREVGRVIKTLQSCGSYQRTAIFLFADHGLSATHTHFELWRGLEEQGRRVLYHPKVFRRDCNAACMISGNGMGHLYLAGGGGKYPSTLSAGQIERAVPSLFDYLLAQPAVDLLAARADDGGVWVRRAEGTAILRENGAGLSYQPVDGDPLGLGDQSRQLSLRESLKVTIASEYPDAPLQLLQLFRASRCGDLVVSARPGFDLRDLHEHPEHKSSHGSLHKDHMLIPLISSLRLPEDFPLRSADIFHLGLRSLGLKGNGKTDGQLPPLS